MADNKMERRTIPTKPHEHVAPKEELKEAPQVPFTATGISQRISTSRTIYFADSKQVIELENICKSHPRCTVSSIIQQLVNAFQIAYKKKHDAGGVVTLNSKITL